MNKDEKNKIIADCEIHQLKTKLRAMQNELQCKQNLLGRAVVQVTKIRSQLKSQARFCSHLGSVLSGQLWKATKKPEIVNMLVHRDSLIEFGRVMEVFLTSFNDNYEGEILIGDEVETRFTLNMMGLVVSYTTVNDGRWYFSQTDVGKKIMQLIISIVLRIHSPNGVQLKKAMYAALYNISIYPVVSPQMITKKLICALNNDIQNDVEQSNEPDLRLFALRLLHSLLRNVCSKVTYDIMKNNMQQSQILKLATTVDVETKTVARDLLDDFRKAQEQFEPKILLT